MNEYFKRDCIKFGQFKLKHHEENPEAPLSPIFINLRILRSYPQLMGQTVKALIELSKDLSYDFVADVPTAGTPFAALFSFLTDKPMISPRKEKKSTGTLDAIDGVFENHKTVLLIDDLITRAGSKLETIEKLESHQLMVKDILVVIDRQQGGVEALKERGVNIHPLFTLSQLLNYYKDHSMITQNKYDEVMDYIKD